MGKTLDSIGKNFIIPLILAAISAAIGIYLGHVFQSSDINFTILEYSHANKQNDTVYAILQNVGTAQAKDLVLVFNYPYKYQLVGYNSTESIPKIVNGSNGILRITADRLSPQSYLILSLQSDSSKSSSSSIWLTSDDSTKVLSIPANAKNFGISTMPFIVPETSSLGIESLVGIGFFMAIRYAMHTKSESLRRNYLGVYNIRITKFDLKKIFIGCTVIVIFFIASAGIVGELENSYSYSPYQKFAIDDKVMLDKFIQLQRHDSSSTDPADAGYFILFIGISIAVVYAVRDINIPAFIWLLKPRETSTVTLNKISSSFYTVKEVTLDDEIKDDWNYDFFAIIVKNRLSGLISKTEVGENAKDRQVQSILEKKHLPVPKWSDTEMYRDNFYLAKDDITLGELKKEMEKNIKRYAAVVNLNQELLGVIDYESIFQSD